MVELEDVDDADMPETDDATLELWLEKVLMTEMVVVTLLDGALATVEGTGRAEVSLGMGDCKEPVMPVKLQNISLPDNTGVDWNLRKERRILGVMSRIVPDSIDRSKIDIAIGTVSI